MRTQLFPMQDGKGIKRDGHRRQVLRREKCEQTLKIAAVRNYLSELGITWPVFSQVHARQGFEISSGMTGLKIVCNL